MRPKALYFVGLLFLLTPFCGLPTQEPTPQSPSADFGDAPDPTYPSLLASDGARALDPSQFWLGAGADTEVEANTVDLDALDDGLVEVLVENEVRVTFEAVKSDRANAGVVYFNLLADTNGDGQWGASENPTGPVPEWIVVNQPLDLAPGEREMVKAAFRLVGGNLEVWLRATLTDSPVQGDKWDGTGFFERGEVEDHRIAPSPWGIECDPDPLVLEHGESGYINLVVTDPPLPDTIEVVAVSGPQGGPLGGDPKASQIAEDPARETGPQQFGAGDIFVDSLDWAVHGSPDTSVGMTYQLEIKVAGPAGVKSVNCTITVNHFLPQLVPPAIHAADGSTIYYGGPLKAQSGGIIPALFWATDSSGQPATGEFLATLGDPPTDPRAYHAKGQLDADGRIGLELVVNWPAGTTKLYCAYRGKVYEVGEITILP